MSTHPCHLKPAPALVDLVMTGRTEGEQVGQRIFASLLTVHDVVRLQTLSLLAAVLAAVAIPQQTGDAQVLVEPRWVLILAALEAGGIQASDIHLHIFDHDAADGKRHAFDHAHHLLRIGLNRGRKSPAAPAGCAVVEAPGPAPLPPPPLLPIGAALFPPCSSL